MTKNVVKSNKTTAIMLVIVFVLPVVLAKVALENNWFNRSATNLGELIAPPLELNAMQSASVENKWRIFYIIPQNCEIACDNAIYSIGQVRAALGKESDRVQAIVFAHETSDAKKIASLQSESSVEVLQTSLISIKKVFVERSNDGIFIVDTLNNVILKYPLYSEQQQAILHSRDILSDMRKLLKLSRIG